MGRGDSVLMIGGSALAENMNKEGSGLRSLEDLLKDLDGKLVADAGDVSRPRRREPVPQMREAAIAPEDVDDVPVMKYTLRR